MKPQSAFNGLAKLAMILAITCPHAAMAQAPQSSLKPVNDVPDIVGFDLRLKPDLILKGQMTGADHQTYREIPFDVPAGVNRLTIEFNYAGKSQRSVIDLGLSDPNGFRGWSGGSKARFTLSASEATPAYMAGPIVPGKWHLILGVPNMRAGVIAPYEAHIHFGHETDPEPEAAYRDTVLSQVAGWYRGDLHDHSGQSDGSCESMGGKRVPCPVFVTLEAAQAHALDFIAMTEHNTLSQNHALRELQPYFDTMLLLSGREVTTFYGHANVFGISGYIPFQLGSSHLKSINDLSDFVHAKGGVISINHPTVPSGEACMGCGWQARDTDYAKIDAIEIVNGGSFHAQGDKAEGPLNGIPFWEARLNEGYHITAIGGSDSHDPKAPESRQVPVGMPRSVIYAETLSQPGLLAGIKSGRVFVDLMASGSHLVDLEAVSEKNHAVMGQNLAVSQNTHVKLKVRLVGVKGSSVEIIRNAQAMPDRRVIAEDQTQIEFDLSPEFKTSGWVRVNVRDNTGALQLVSNPIYISLIK